VNFNANQTDPILVESQFETLDTWVVRGGTVTVPRDPTGGLWGHAAVFNPADGTWFSYEAEALVGFAEDPMFWPQNGQPATNPDLYTSDQVLLANPSAPLNFDLPDISTPGIHDDPLNPMAVADSAAVQVSADPTLMVATALPDPGGVTATEPEKQRDLVSASLLTNAVSNEYLSGDEWSADWVFTFPGRYAYRYLLESQQWDVDYALGNPFDVVVDRTTGQGCVPVTVNGISADPDGNVFAIYGREEQSATSNDIDFSPGTVEGFALCYEVNVIGVNDESTTGYSEALQSSAVFAGLGSPFTFGWMNAGFTQTFSRVEATNTADPTPTYMKGLPFIGFAAITDNRTATKRGGAFQHNVSRAVQGN
jgi:hypothetical protein